MFQRLLLGSHPIIIAIAGFTNCPLEKHNFSTLLYDIPSLRVSEFGILWWNSTQNLLCNLWKVTSTRGKLGQYCGPSGYDAVKDWHGVFLYEITINKSIKKQHRWQHCAMQSFASLKPHKNTYLYSHPYNRGNLTNQRKSYVISWLYEAKLVKTRSMKLWS